MTLFTTYRYPSGEIDEVYDCSPPSEIRVQPAVLERGCRYVLGDNDPDRVYFPMGERTPRPTLTDEVSVTIAADGVETYSLPLPTGTIVEFEDEIYTCGEDDPLVFNSNIPGDHVIRLRPPFPWQSVKVTVTCL